MTTNVSFYPFTQASSIRNGGMNTFWAQKNARKKLVKTTFCDFLTINKQCVNFIGFLGAIFVLEFYFHCLANPEDSLKNLCDHYISPSYFSSKET